MIRFDLLTIFPDIFDSYINESILGRAQKAGLIKINSVDIRKYADDLPAPRLDTYFVYAILCENGDIYIGQTDNIQHRWDKHLRGTAAIHTKKHKPKQLIHYETYGSSKEAVDREKWLKTGFGRKWLKREWQAGRTRQAGKHSTTDDKPYGGGAGMVMKIEPIYKAVVKNSLYKTSTTKSGLKHAKSQRIVLLSAKGRQFTQEVARELTKYKQIMLIAGRYEGVDERVSEYIADEEISIGPYILSGGELPALIIVEAVARLIPGVLGNEESLINESFSGTISIKDISHDKAPPAYTRPEIFFPKRGIEWRVPEVLLSGNHKRIKEWRRKQ